MNRLTLFYDIAGRVAKESQLDEFFTVGGAIIPTGLEDQVRDAIGWDTPKWRDTNDSYLSLILDILKNFKVRCTVVKIEKTEPAWSKFWNAGDQQYNYLSSRTKPKPGFAKSGNLLKEWAFGKCSATGLGLHLKDQGRPTILDTNGYSILYLKIICDTDIQGQENRDVFENNWKQWCKATKLTSHLGIRPYLDCAEFKTEQEDNLLLLPDYLAGYIHYSSNPRRIARPVCLSEKGADDFGQELSTIVQFDLIEYSFNEILPNLGSFQE
ncbi:MAG: hypothetical protein ABSF79_02995 [Smithellaceae bacterium]|jgi:hypothetical protein